MIKHSVDNKQDASTLLSSQHQANTPLSSQHQANTPLSSQHQAGSLLTKKDFASEQEVRWCPGCGDYAILAAVQKFLPELVNSGQVKRENLVFVSGIGCASRFPYYLRTYGFHTIHGRAPAIAAGLKLARPELSVWLVVGDGDGLSIGLGHLLHLLRRDLNINILFINNGIYALTKGQSSPLSQPGQITNSAPNGVVTRAFCPLALAEAAGCDFLARSVDSDAALLQEIFQAACAHEGSAFIEIIQNCPIYNDKSGSLKSGRVKLQAQSPIILDDKIITYNFDPITAKIEFQVSDQSNVALAYGETKAAVAYGEAKAAVAYGETNASVVYYDALRPNKELLVWLAQLQPPEFGWVTGIFKLGSRAVQPSSAIRSGVAEADLMALLQV